MKKLQFDDLSVYEMETEMKTFGMPTKPREDEPTMFDILSWDVNSEDLRYNKKSKIVARSFGDYNKFKYKVDRSNGVQLTETQDAFRPFEINENLNIKGKDSDSTINQSLLTRKEIVNDTKINEIQVDASSNINQKKFSISPEITKKIISNNLFDDKNKNKLNVLKQNINTNKALAPIIVCSSEVEKIKNNTIIQIPINEIKKNKNLKTQSKKTMSISQRNRRIDRIKKFNEQTRWLPNSAFQTYFGKPAFENYGFANTNPSWGGPIYGEYLKSHNINPQRGDNTPEADQVYLSSQIASEKINYSRSHIPRKCMNEYKHSQEQVQKINQQLPLQIIQNKPIKKCGTIQKPNLLASRRFASEIDENNNE